ncbi:MAG: Ig-like domain-containing protein [Bacteroidales bacterium]|nr:Ig-like domain-containing protein [Bacteroidales bacterium]MDT8430399.1 Ig-like domain-containing protein [Bacteroidales bacterium]
MRRLATVILALLFHVSAQPQDNMIIAVSPDTSYQTMRGFGAALAYYEGWLTAHPKKAEIYEAIFGELSLDILRLRNAFEYDPEMINRAKEFVTAAQSSLGKPIDVLVSSWGPPGNLKSNGDKSNGGTLRYTIVDGTVQFDYAGFAHWWNRSLDEYNTNGIYPAYISLQNEPDFTASYESCRFDPSEKITTSDTIAGYNKALRAVHDSITTRTNVPKILGPETVGIGYNAVEKYVNALDISLLDGIAHHLYHGVNANDPYASSDFQKVGTFYPEVPHYQTEYSLGDWWSLAGLMYKSLHDENVAAYLYWELIWDGDGLVSLDFPWNSSQWQDPQKGYTKTKDFYVFKQYSAFIHPGWQRVATGQSADAHKILTFVSPGRDSAATVIINTSESEELTAAIAFRGFSVAETEIYRTSAEVNCAPITNIPASAVICPPVSITTVAMTLVDDQSFIPVESITFSQSDTVIDTWQGTLDLQPVVLPEDATNDALFWKILTGSEIATVTSSGMLQARGTGDGLVVVQASATDGSGITAEQEYTLINQVLVVEIKLFASAGIIDTYHGNIQFTAEVLPEEAFNKTVAWELTSGTDIATIDQNGLLQALGTGDGKVVVRVAATDGSDVAAVQEITIKNQVLVEEIRLDAPEDSISTPQGSLQFTVEVLPESASSKVVSWELTTGSDIATIDQNGLLQAMGNANGTAEVKVSATDGSGISTTQYIAIVGQEISARDRTGTHFRAGTAHGTIRVNMAPAAGPGVLRIYTVSGMLLGSFDVPAFSAEFVVNERMKPGIYMVEFSKNGNRFIRRVALTE